MNMHKVLLCVVVALCTMPCRGQRLATSYFEGGGPNLTSPACCGALNAVPIQFLGAVSAVEEFMSAHAPGSATISIFDSDPSTQLPRNQLASGTFWMSPGETGYRGAVMTPLVLLQWPNRYYLVLAVDGSSVPSSGSQFSGMPLYTFLPWSGWGGPNYVRYWSVLLYSGVHAGLFQGHGAAKPGTANIHPVIEGHGWPNTGNPLEIAVSAVPNGAPCLFVVGPRATTSYAFATLYAQPDATLFTLAPSGVATLRLQIPNSAAFQGVALTTQALIADPCASFGVSHSGGLEMVIGH